MASIHQSLLMALHMSIMRGTPQRTTKIGPLISYHFQKCRNKIKSDRSLYTIHDKSTKFKLVRWVSTFLPNQNVLTEDRHPTFHPSEKKIWIKIKFRNKQKQVQGKFTSHKLLKFLCSRLFYPGGYHYTWTISIL